MPERQRASPLLALDAAGRWGTDWDVVVALIERMQQGHVIPYAPCACRRGRCPPLHHCVPTSCPSQARHVWSSMARACHGFSVPPDSPLAFSPFRLGLDRCQLDVKTFDRTMDDYVRAHLQLVVDLWGAGAGAAMAPWTVLVSFLRTLPSSGRATHTKTVAVFR